MLKLKLQYFWPPDAKTWLIWEDPDAGKDWGQEEKGMTEDEMAGWHHWLNGHESGWTPGVGDGQGGLACCNLWGCKESDMTEWLNWTELNWTELKDKEGFPGGSDRKEFACNVGDLGSIPGSQQYKQESQRLIIVKCQSPCMRPTNDRIITIAEVSPNAVRSPSPTSVSPRRLFSTHKWIVWVNEI